MKTFVLGGGCFWCLDAAYRRIEGVTDVVSGYAGGILADPTYAQVSTGKTGHAEVVSVTFDEHVLPESVVLSLFFALHNPTTRDRQGADIGPQYRSIMLYQDDAQKRLFANAIEQAASLWDQPIVTELAPLEQFYPAEDEHQDYFTKNPESGYCSIVISPKLAKLRQQFTRYIKKEV